MRIRRLGWAGIEIETGDGGQRVVIDAITSLSSMEAFVGPPRAPLPPPRGPVDLALVTHLHEDHTDAELIATSLAGGGRLLRPEPAGGDFLEIVGTSAAEAVLAERGVPAEVVRPWQTVRAGAVTATAVPAVDGFGDPQVSWVVEVEGVRVFHGGDTTFHGSWWSIAMRHGPVDVAFLPVNGALCDWPHRQPASPLPACLDPDSAAAAAAILRAGLAVPIHYDTIQHDRIYRQVDDPPGRFLAAAEHAGVPAKVMAPGEELSPVTTR